jgi:uncharacterized SAM-binding protein YcdF (DUF218 family)
VYELKLVLQAAVLPPMSFVLLAAAGGLLLAWRRTRAPGAIVLACAVLAAAALGTRAVASTLLAVVVADPPLAVADVPPDAAAIVVLTGGSAPRPEMDGIETPSGASIARAEYAAWLQGRTGLPIVVAGGAPLGQRRPEAAVVADALRDRFGATVSAEIGRGRDTAESVLGLADAVPGGPGTTVVLVTDAMHMGRAAIETERAGLRVVRAPVGHPPPPCLEFACLLPSVEGAYLSGVAVNHWLGRLVGRLR